jgi:hypothetical protein
MAYVKYEDALTQILEPYFQRIYNSELSEDELYELLSKLYNAGYYVGYVTGKSEIRDYINQGLEMDLSQGDDENIN